MKNFMLMALMLSSPLSFAHNHKNLKAHSHSKAEFDIVADADEKKIIITFESAAMPIIGFEGNAKNKEQVKKLEKVQALWKNGGAWIDAVADKNCDVTASVLSNVLDDDEDEDHDHDHDDDHDHQHHSSIEAELMLRCKDMTKISKLKLSFLKEISKLKVSEEKIEKLDVGVVPKNNAPYKKALGPEEFIVEL